MLDDSIRELAQNQAIAIISTVMPKGEVQSQMVWVDADDEHLLVNTVVTHQKARNIARDPRVTVVLVDPTQTRRYAEVRGRVVESVTGPAARAHLDELSMRYMGTPYARETGERVLLKIAPERERPPAGGR